MSECDLVRALLGGIVIGVMIAGIIVWMTEKHDDR